MTYLLAICPNKTSVGCLGAMTVSGDRNHSSRPELQTTPVPSCAWAARGLTTANKGEEPHSSCLRAWAVLPIWFPAPHPMQHQGGLAK